MISLISDRLNAKGGTTAPCMLHGVSTCKVTCGFASPRDASTRVRGSEHYGIRGNDVMEAVLSTALTLAARSAFRAKPVRVHLNVHVSTARDSVTSPTPM